jgi:hypothetical protein
MPSCPESTLPPPPVTPIGAPLPPPADPLSPLTPEDIIFRHTFLHRFEQQEAVDSLEYLGKILADYLDETGQWGQRTTLTGIGGKLGAVAADLREIELYLDQVRRERFATALDFQEERLATLAERWHKKVGKLARRLEEELAP